MLTIFFGKSLMGNTSTETSIAENQAACIIDSRNSPKQNMKPNGCNCSGQCLTKKCRCIKIENSAWFFIIKRKKVFVWISSKKLLKYNDTLSLMHLFLLYFQSFFAPCLMKNIPVRRRKKQFLRTFQPVLFKNIKTLNILQYEINEKYLNIIISRFISSHVTTTIRMVIKSNVSGCCPKNCFWLS